MMPWPMTPDGQAQFLHDLTTAIKAVPDYKGIVFVWWYPEAIPVKSLRIWRQGAEGLFDEQGRPLPALKAFSVTE